MKHFSIDTANSLKKIANKSNHYHCDSGERLIEKYMCEHKKW